MKKYLVIILLAAMAVPALGADYRHGLGFVVGSKEGFSYKGFFTDNLAIQVDAAWQINRTVGCLQYASYSSDTRNLSFWDASINPNLLWQDEAVRFSWGSLDWFAGGGLSAGVAGPFNNSRYDYLEEDMFGKLGVNAIGGVELAFRQPIALSLDFRPGYALGVFNSDSEYRVHAFDWAATIGLRYTF